MDHRRFQRRRQLHDFPVRACAAAAAHQRNIFRVVQGLRQGGQLIGGRQHQWQLRWIPVSAGGFRCGLQRDIARQDNHRYATIQDGFTHRNAQHLRQLLGVRYQLTVVAAFAEQLLRMGFLKVTTADFAGRNMGRNRQDRHAVAMAVKKAVNQVQVTGSA
ncbi:hypothetical protein hypothetical protein [Pantoea ananatis AJ13355]|uniref:Uncharacterized protein n=1 Tax=Pantoea ananatis (strain AJ13355) TaxID=932677 RepID=A0A0H3L1U8_PANAA|nr:hypothetical protein hypothetical protein [Pantoea ananatis AJ13355]